MYPTEAIFSPLTPLVLSSFKSFPIFVAFSKVFFPPPPPHLNQSWHIFLISRFFFVPLPPPQPAATDAKHAQAKVVQTLTLELEDARKAQKLAEDKSAMAAASAAALVAADTSRPRTTLEGNALRTPTSSWRGAVHGFDSNNGGGPSHSNAGSNVGSPG